MLEICVAMEIEQHPSLSINGDICPAFVDDSTLKSEDKSETSVSNNLDDLECIFGDPLVTSPPTLEEVFDQNNEDGDLIGQTKEENKDDNDINLM